MPSLSSTTTTTVTAPSKKRRTRKDSADDGAKNARGRPRVESHDETAADRRRTQIRLAQRAYRMRKETTITSLQEKVSELKGIVENMSSTFIDFSDFALSSGLGTFNPQLADDLQRAARRFAVLSEQANSTVEGACDAHDEASRPKCDDSLNGDGSHSEASQHSPPIMIEPYTEDSDVVPMQHIGLGFFTTASSEEQSSTAQQSNSLSTWSQSQAMPIDNPPTPDSQDADMGALIRTPSPSPGPLAPPRLSTNFTYSFEESTFARRLHRACLERAFYVLSRPGNKWVDESFKLLRPFKSAEELREHCRARLAMGPNQPLESQNYYPFSHLGGAGTHYPRTVSHSFPARMPGAKLTAWLRSQEQIGTLSEKAVHLPITASGFEGVWFDPDDVEGYLAERGVFISPQAYFAEAELVEEPEPTSANWKVNPESSLYDQRQTRLQNASDVLFGKDLSASFGQGADQFGKVLGETSQLSGFEAGDDPMMMDMSIADDWAMPTPPPGPVAQENKSTRHVVIDVSKLVDGLVNRAICLGRTPGYRRHDVERALQKAITAF